MAGSDLRHSPSPASVGIRKQRCSLLQAGADPKLYDGTMGESAFDYARVLNLTEVVAYMEKQGKVKVNPVRERQLG